MFGKKKKEQKVNKLKEFISNQDFQIPQVDEDTTEGLKVSKDPFNDNRFTSPLFGNFVKDSTANVVTKGINDVSTYDIFREPDKRIKKADDYSDFASGIINNQMGKEIMGYEEILEPSKKPSTYKPVSNVKSEGFDFSKYEEPAYEKSEEVKEVDEQYDFLDSNDVELTKPAVSELDEYEETLKRLRELESKLGIKKPQNTVKKEIIKEERVSIPAEQSFERPVIENKEAEKVEVKRPEISYKKYKFPPKSIFKSTPFDNHDKPDWINEQILSLDNVLQQFGIDGHVENFTKGPSITRYEIKLEAGVNVKKVLQIEDNIKMVLAVKSLRIEAPIPGKPNVGVEVPNVEKTGVPFGNIVTDDFINDGKPLRAALGMSIDGKPVYEDIAKMPHCLIAGTTGSGKSVSVNTILVSLLLKNTPDDLRLILVDPKQVEFIAYADIPHLITPVITDSRLASQALKWAVEEMNRRYTTFLNAKVRDIGTYNEKALEMNFKKMPYIVVVIDELADLMLVAPDDVNNSLQSLAQKSRAAGIHLLLATQRPTVNVINGTIKTNIPHRMAFRVSSYQDSMVILDQKGAEELLGYGDMLMKTTTNLERIQGAYISDDEINTVVDYIKDQFKPDYVFQADDLQKLCDKASKNADDPMFPIIARYVVENDCASINRIQKEFNLGFNRTQRIFEMLDEYGITGGGSNGKQREVLITIDDLEKILE